MSGAEPEALDALAARLIETVRPVSAAELCARLGGWPRGKLTSALEDLYDLGAPISETASGYTLKLQDPLDETAIRAALPASLPMTIRVRRVCRSTNEALRACATPALCVAEAQSAGRGRRGAPWVQAFGMGLALSLSVPVPRGRLDPLALALAGTVAGVLQTFGYAGIGLKWPNDLYARGAKLGGLMVEAEGAAPGRLCVGLGLNVHDAPALAGRTTTALAELGSRPERNHLVAALTVSLMDALNRYDADGFAPFAPEFSALDLLANRVVNLCDRSAAINGVARGIDAFGALILDTAQGRRLCRAGEVSLAAWPDS